MLLIIDDKTGNWKQINKEEKSNLTEEEQKKVLYIDKKLKEKLDFGIKMQNNDNDVVGLVGGDEGSGKSHFAANCMRYISKDKFNPRTDMVGSDYEDGINKIERIKNGTWLMFDEGNIFFLSTEVLKREQRDLHKIFSIFRQKRLFVLIVAPSFFRLGSYFALDRSKFICITYVKNGKRSYFKYFGEKLKERLYHKGKKGYNDSAVKPNFRGRFQSCDLLDDEAYKRFKLKTLTGSLTKAKAKQKELSPKQIEINFKKEFIKNNIDKTEEELGKLLDIHPSRAGQLRRDIQKEKILEKNQLFH